MKKLSRFDEYERERQEKDKLISDIKTGMSVLNVKIEILEEMVGRQEMKVKIPMTCIKNC